MLRVFLCPTRHRTCCLLSRVYVCSCNTLGTKPSQRRTPGVFFWIPRNTEIRFTGIPENTAKNTEARFSGISEYTGEIPKRLCTRSHISTHMRGYTTAMGATTQRSDYHIQTSGGRGEGRRKAGIHVGTISGMAEGSEGVIDGTVGKGGAPTGKKDGVTGGTPRRTFVRPGNYSVAKAAKPVPRTTSRPPPRIIPRSCP